jgi:hypothetical protein
MITVMNWNVPDVQTLEELFYYGANEEGQMTYTKRLNIKIELCDEDVEFLDTQIEHWKNARYQEYEIYDYVRMSDEGYERTLIDKGYILKAPGFSPQHLPNYPYTPEREEEWRRELGLKRLRETGTFNIALKDALLRWENKAYCLGCLKATKSNNPNNPFAPCLTTFRKAVIKKACQ